MTKCTRDKVNSIYISMNKLKIVHLLWLWKLWHDESQREDEGALMIMLQKKQKAKKQIDQKKTYTHKKNKKMETFMWGF